MKGYVTIRGDRIALASNGFRDIAAGVRNWDVLRHYRLAWPVFDDGSQWLRITHIEETVDYASTPSR